MYRTDAMLSARPAMAPRVERTFLDAEHLAGHVLDCGHDRVAMQARPAGEDL
ncbi:MAG TPA: hypothetical protein VK335_04835 [Bryobacteraceae bacterium]|nr:hypothetical protein [Bryobacteraceae bacterium]